MDPTIQALLRSPEFRVVPEQGSPALDGDAGGGERFGSALASSLARLEETQVSADAQSRALATGQATDIASVVTEVERAVMSMQLAVQVRNRAVDAYHEIFRMQV